PEDAVQDVPRQVERDLPLECRELVKVFRLARLCELLHCLVRTLDVRTMVLVVVQFHDATREMGFERAVVVCQIRQNVACHVQHPFRRWMSSYGGNERCRWQCAACSLFVVPCRPTGHRGCSPDGATAQPLAHIASLSISR